MKGSTSAPSWVAMKGTLWDVLLDAVVRLQAPETNPNVFEVSRKEGEMIAFVAFDIDKRVNALRDALDRPTATVVRIGGNECA